MYKKKKNILDIDNLIFIVGVTSSIVLLRVNSISFFKWTVILLVICLFIKMFKNNEIVINKIDYNYLLIYFVKIFTVIGALYYGWSSSWKKAALVQIIWFTLYAMVCFFQSIFSQKTIDIFRKGIIISIIIQINWSLFQYILWKINGIDINKLIFSDILGMISEASKFKYGELSVSGLAWHPINMAPILILGYCVFKKWYVRVLIFAIGVITNNSTVLIGLTVCLVLDLFFSFSMKKIVLKRKHIVSLFIIILVGILVIFKTDIIEKLISNFIFLYERLTGKFYDGGSTAAHIRYYMSLPDIFRMSSVYKILFGYGDGCSGYVMGTLFNQYTDIGSWAIECDIVNILVSNGLIGFIFFYYWLFKIAISGKKIDKYYFIFIISIIICGVTYNVQYDWVIVLEMFLAFSIKLNYNFFSLKFRN
ncbi:hypothetical protein EHW71_17280 [Clostridium butyricum]|uniref:hypothetical protein n=1 Tax=Clostridium butyricum TaxID=1492 RepID=UPI000F543DEF|nr:hypothetical protein [Clostridium butyricum]RQN02448.1 hypothetical protein EHW71_17280 [Clostridium butyricum]